MGIEYVCESTGVFLTAESAQGHIDSGNTINQSIILLICNHFFISNLFI